MKITEEVFLKDVAQHQMKVLLDNGVYRHLRFASTGQYSGNQWFQIVTWPGYLAYSGDMGCFVFSRLEDMFEFFRTRPCDEPAKLHVNIGYWAEKLEAVDRCGCDAGAEQFSLERLEARVEATIKEWIEDFSLSAEEGEELRDDVRDQVLSVADDGEYEVHRALRDFSCEVGGQPFEFSDTWEWDLKEYTLHFVWCCYALAWAIQQYDASKVEMVAAS